MYPVTPSLKAWHVLDGMSQLVISSCALALALALLTPSFINIMGLDPLKSLNIDPEASMDNSSDSLSLLLEKNKNNEIFLPMRPRISDRFALLYSNYFAHSLLLTVALRQNG